MRLHEDFTRCHCGHAYLRKEVFVLASYELSVAGNAKHFNELPNKSETRYTCEKCNTLVFTKKE